MPNERTYQDLLDRVGALEGMVADRLSSQLLQNPAARRPARQADRRPAVRRRRRADAKAAAAARHGLGATRRHRPGGGRELGDTRIPHRRRRRTTRPSTPSASSPSATCTTSTSTNRSACSGSCRSSRSCSRPARCGCRPARAPIGLYQFDRRDVLRYTRARPLGAYRRVLGYGRGPGPRGSRAEHRLPHAVQRTSSTRSRCSGATSGSPT